MREGLILKMLARCQVRIFAVRTQLDEECDKAVFGLRKVGDLAYLRAQTQSQTMKTSEIGKGLR